MTASRIEASFDVAASEALSDEQKRRIIARLGPRVIAVAQDARSQARNRELALERLRRRLTAALARAATRAAPTRPTAVAPPRGSTPSAARPSASATRRRRGAAD